MNDSCVRVLFFSDTHLGFDYPLRPRVKKRHRGPDFFRNFDAVLEHAAQWPADLLIHGGDLFFRSKVPREIVNLVYDRLNRFAIHGIPVIIVPGNHERSVLPESIFLMNPIFRIFRKPEFFHFKVREHQACIFGFPYESDIREHFTERMEHFRKILSPGNLNLLCMHQIVQGARVGPNDHIFNQGIDVIPVSLLPEMFCSILSGHIHRNQIIWYGEPSKPCFFPGSIERTSFAEESEDKGYYRIEFVRATEGYVVRKHEFVMLPARKMVRLEFCPVDRTKAMDELSDVLAKVPEDSIVRLEFTDGAMTVSAEEIRKVSSPTLTIEFKGHQTRITGLRIELKEKIRTLPESPGIYLFLDKSGRVLYIGKSVNLRKRVQSYFNPLKPEESHRMKKLSGLIHDLKYTVARSELHALLMENEMIKEHSPEFNILLKELKQYFYLCFSKDEYRALCLVDSGNFPAEAALYGPFRKKHSALEFRDLIIEHFNLRSCTSSIPDGNCLNFDIRKCTGPCRGKINGQDYRALCIRAESFLDGNSSDIIGVLEQKIGECSESLEFEKAAVYDRHRRFFSSYIQRQNFFREFYRSFTVVRERKPVSMTSIFNCGKLLKVEKKSLSHEKICEICTVPLDIKSSFHDIRSIDAADIVYRWIRSIGNDGESHFLVPKNPAFRPAKG